VNLGHPDVSNVKMAEANGKEGERVEKPGDLTAALQRCQRAMHDGRPYLVDVKIENWGAGSDSDWYDFFSVAKNEPRRS
jgi:thiamine pyrophosphate-dependent acetolactate synthase large subunit-like protein